MIFPPYGPGRRGGGYSASGFDAPERIMTERMMMGCPPPKIVCIIGVRFAGVKTRIAHIGGRAIRAFLGMK